MSAWPGQLYPAITDRWEPCECEDRRHFPEAGQPARAHKYGNRFPAAELENVKTPWGTFQVCRDCRESCGAFQEPEPSTYQTAEAHSLALTLHCATLANFCTTAGPSDD